MLDTLVAGAPDIFVPIVSDEWWELYPAVAILGVFIAIFGVSTLPGAGDSHPRLRLVRAIIAIVLGAALIPGGILATIEGANAAHAQVAAAEAAYAEPVIEWLADDYGIEADTKSVMALVDGDSLAADYDGGRVVISLTKTTTGTYTVVDENQMLLPLLSLLSR